MPVLQKIAKRCELRLSLENQFTPECLSEIEGLLHDVYSSRQPKPNDYEDRLQLIGLITDISKELYGNSEYPTVEEYGSFVMDIFTADSDLDLSVNLTATQARVSRDMMVKALIKLAEKFRLLQSRGFFRDLKRVLGARVPIIKAVHCDSGSECDISIENMDGIKKSRIIKIICGIDLRFQRLSFMMKAWAKAHQINSAKTKTLNSLSIISLVAFHLQTREPPILPPFSAIFKDGTDPEAVMEIARKCVDYGKNNSESTADLFISLLVKLASVKQYWSKGLCASTFFGTWILKVWGNEFGYLSVEDFITRSENVARAVNREQLDRIYDCINNSLNHLARFKDGRLQKSELRELLFGLDPIIRPKTKFIRRPKGFKSKTRAQTLRATRKRKRRAERRKTAQEPSTVSPNNVITPPSLLNSLPNTNAGLPAMPTPRWTQEGRYAGVQSTPTFFWPQQVGNIFGQVTAAPISQPGLINSQNGKSFVP
uniref:Poly(A) RNA polymerase mitochondrial-like central palm domain-containing protein n=1 Tax=Kalanchoe fedtschenkoi TaxID=63787 RepID=A0A7N0U0T7_KALFE